MERLKHDLLTGKYTEVWHEDRFDIAPHTFVVMSAGDETKPLGEIHFQDGPIKDVGVNGVMNEDLIAMIICRLEHFNQTDFRCRENSMAITKLEESLLWLRKRTIGREQRGVEGTHIK